MQAQANNSKGEPSNAHSRTNRYGNQEAKIIQRTLKGNNPNLWGCPSSSNFDPLGETTALLAFNIHNVGVTPAPAADTVLLDGIRVRPILVLFNALLFVLGCRLQPGDSGQLPRRSVGRTMLNSSVPIAEVTEVVDVAGGQENTGGQRMDRRITPLDQTVS